ncbi:MAG: hypothetical protein PHE56_15705, partial [Bacteroidales bacterium]|nr:hypothetical protein [Bacteroidales bacterium]
MKRNYFRIVLLLALIAISYLSKAGIEIFNNRHVLEHNGYICVKDDKFATMSSNSPNNWGFKNYSAQAKVSLVFDKGNSNWTSFPTANITEIEVPVRIMVLKYNYLNNQFESELLEKTLSLTISSDGQLIRDNQSILVVGAHQVSVITDADYSNPEIADILQHICIEAEIEIERFYQLPSYGNTINAPTNVTGNLSNDFINFSWDHVKGAEYYELEYAFVNGYSQFQIEPGLFKRNSTRVLVRDTKYAIPNIFETGYLVYRVRAVGKKNSYVGPNLFAFTELYSKWSFEDNTGSGLCSSLFAGSLVTITDDSDLHTKNKQYIASFAEDGKSKFSVNYFDGSMRSRQSQVQQNSDSIVLVAETKYDYLGRGVLTLLPAPKGNKKLIYEPLFNRTADPLAPEYNKEQYDITTNLKPEAIGNASGAGLYYSTLNTSNPYIPDAGGYPFVRTVLTEDNTGRVKTQGGVGEEFQPELGFTDHTTDYTYTKPLQPEIDLYFGAEVGLSKYYTKEVVKDPNGQLNVSVKDLKGNIILTGLAGAKPNNLMFASALENHNLNIDLFHESDNQVINTNNSNEIVFNYQFYSDHPQKIDVNYLLQSNNLDYNICGDFCFDCVYDLFITITDENGNALPIYESETETLYFNESIPIGAANEITQLVDGVSTYDISTDCENYPDIFERNWALGQGNLGQVVLGVGSYYITKKLVLREDVLNQYTREYLEALLNSTTCLPNYNTYVSQYINQANTDACDFDCSDCLSFANSFLSNNGIGINDTKPTVAQNPALVTENSPPSPYTQEEYDFLVETWSAYEDLVAMCNGICNNLSNPICEAGYQTMLADMSLNGQYGQVCDMTNVDNNIVVITEDTEIHPEDFRLSVFNENNLFPELVIDVNTSIPRTWRYPENDVYYDEFGFESFVKVVQTGTNQYSPEITDDDLLVTIDGEKYIRPHHLQNVEDFVANWKSSWAKSLVYLHPEFPYYENCV